MEWVLLLGQGQNPNATSGYMPRYVMCGLGDGKYGWVSLGGDGKMCKEWPREGVGGGEQLDWLPVPKMWQEKTLILRGPCEKDQCQS